jgi:hypothetical protein
MTIRLSPDAARMPIYAHNMTEEDRQTYRRWARGWYISTATVLVALLAVGFSIRHPPGPQTARGSDTSAVNTKSASVPQFTGRIVGP